LLDIIKEIVEGLERGGDEDSGEESKPKGSVH
jgi:hypothetical protein